MAGAQLCAYLSTHLILDDSIKTSFRKVFLSRYECSDYVSSQRSTLVLLCLWLLMLLLYCIVVLYLSIYIVFLSA